MIQHHALAVVCNFRRRPRDDCKITRSEAKLQNENSSFHDCSDKWSDVTLVNAEQILSIIEWNVMRQTPSGGRNERPVNGIEWTGAFATVLFSTVCDMRDVEEIKLESKQEYIISLRKQRNSEEVVRDCDLISYFCFSIKQYRSYAMDAIKLCEAALVKRQTEKKL